MIAKLWQLFGWYYFFLALALLVYIFLSPKNRKLLLKAVLLATVLLNLWLFGRFLAQNFWQMGDFFGGPGKIMAKTSSGQSLFAQTLGGRLPLTATGCVFWYNDTPTVFLISELYPRRFRAIPKGASLSGCDYVISPGTYRLFRPKP